MAQHLHQRIVRLLVIDVGNTSTAVGLWSNGRVSQVSHHDGKVHGLEDLGDLTRYGRIDGVGYVSVVPKADAKWCRSVKKAGIPFHQLSYKDELPGIALDYPNPETIGADRLADAVGAVSRYGAPIIVMDFGTALTAAVVTKDHLWRGGVIAPGFPLMRDYLFERTAKLPRMEIGSGKVPKIGRSTEEAMRFGAIVGYRGMVREIVAELKKNFSADFKLVATGGFAKRVLSGLDMPFKVDPTLTLYGAGLICSKSL